MSLSMQQVHVIHFGTSDVNLVIKCRCSGICMLLAWQIWSLPKKTYDFAVGLALATDVGELGYYSEGEMLDCHSKKRVFF